MPASKSPVNGSCLCGGVRFIVRQFTGPFELCHCSRCRKVTGAANVPAIGCNTDDFTLLQGEHLIEKFEAPILHAPPAYTVHFCRRCGSPVPPAHPEGDFMEIAAGLLDDDPGLVPDRHIFVEHVPEWDHLTDELPRLTREDVINHRSKQ